MHRERKFRVWRPKIECECGHPLEAIHPGKGKCWVEDCSCLKFVWKKKGNKLHAKKQEFKGVQYHSGLEAKCAADLEYKMKCGEISSVERQVKMPLEVKGKHIANYYVDFLVTHNDGVQEYIEVKGMVTPEARLKMRMFEAQYCDGRNVKYSVVR